jgi:hypothetical protein
MINLRAFVLICEVKLICVSFIVSAVWSCARVHCLLPDILILFLF